MKTALFHQVNPKKAFSESTKQSLRIMETGLNNIVNKTHS